MAYLFKQKLNLFDLVGSSQPKKVLIFEPEEYLGALYGHYLRFHNFDVKHCPNLWEIKELISGFNPRVLIFNIDNPLFLAFLKNLRRDFPNLHLVSTGLSGAEGIKELMAAGVLGHINRRFSRPKDLALIVKSILN